MEQKVRALGLLSGGLDSMLAAAVLRAQGIEVTGFCLESPFYNAAGARAAAAHLGIPLIVVDFTAKFLPLIYDPPHGFGRGHNPCIDCHILMLREAGTVMAAAGFDFVFTGEVLGQRPMSQNRGSLNLIAKESGFLDLLLRPLSARLLKPTQPELAGLVDRERLLDFSGRGRKRQIALAVELGITQYPAPAGGCLLTDPGYAARLKELLRRQERAARRDLELLKWGRHFRLAGGAKAVVGRTQRDNEALLGLMEAMDYLIKVDDIPGPLVLVMGGTAEDLAIAAGLAAAYSDAPTGAAVTVSVRQAGRETSAEIATPPKNAFTDWLL